jgi:rhamnosyltransferase
VLLSVSLPGNARCEGAYGARRRLLLFLGARRPASPKVSGTRGPSAENVVAAIVTMGPGPDVVRHVETLTGRVHRVVVVDNGSGPDASFVLESIAAMPSVEVIRNPANLGIARALNQGAQFAIDAGVDWLLTLDQDAEPTVEIVSVARRTFDAHSGPDRIAVIGSASFETPQVGWLGAGQPGQPWVEEFNVVTAGSFVSLAVFARIGGFREDLFVDYVDTEYCLRARAEGYLVLASRAPAMSHRIGQPTRRWIGRRAVYPTNHSAVRRYYITRNRFFVWRRYWRTETRYVARDILASQKELVKLVLFEQDRCAKVRAMAAGLRDGLRSVSGKRGRRGRDEAR